MDGLRDRDIKHFAKTYNLVKQKLLQNIHTWINNRSMPGYLATARTVVLSKDESQFPLEGGVRVIAILPALYKLTETVVHELLLSELLQKAPLHPH